MSDDDTRVEEHGESAGSASVRSLVSAIAGAAMVIASLVLVVVVRIADVQAGYRLYALQRQKVELTQQKSALELEIASLKRPDRLARIGAELGLAPPRADQVLRVSDEGRPAP